MARAFKCSLTQLRQMAESARGDAVLGGELRAHVLGNIEGFAKELGISTARVAAAVAGVSEDHALGTRLSKSIKDILEKRREAAAVSREEAAQAACARVTESVAWHGDVLSLDVVALAEAARGVAFVQFVDPDDNDFTVNARILREILALRDDALVLVSPSGVEIQWGAAGRIRLRHFDNAVKARIEGVRAIFLPDLYKVHRPLVRMIAPGTRAIYRRTGGEVTVWGYDGEKKAYRCLTAMLGIERFIPMRELQVIETLEAACDAAAE